VIHTDNHRNVTSTETTRVIRRGELRILSEDLADQDDLEAEAFRRGRNAGLDLAARLVAQDGDRAMAALIRRQRKAE
jgi:hypothetical protein